MNDRSRAVLEANIAVHTKLASFYERTEPHFRAENVAVVDAHIRAAAERTGAKRLLDLGCGTGFVIDIAKRHVPFIVGVDVTRAMLDRVDTSGPAAIELVEHDTGTLRVWPGAFDVVTAYSFLHHLYDVRPTFATASRALRKGGIFYADLDPNRSFWDAIARLDGDAAHDPIVRREIDAVLHIDDTMHKEHGIPGHVFNDAEYGKNIAGGFREESLRRGLLAAGFSSVRFHYYWFLGQAFVVNDPARPSRDERLERAREMDAVLQRVLPLSRSLYKYIGFVAEK
jgi:ubiquinone/menaquinone biosynthesis C-methylase UbiE